MSMDREFFEGLIKEAQESSIGRYVVGAVITRNTNILLLERPKEEFMGGIYELPSGKVEDGEQLDAALYREVEEETGLKIISIRKYLGYFDYNSKSGKRTRQFNFEVGVKEPFEIKLQEHSNYAWATRDNLYRYPVTESVRQILDFFWV